MNNKVLNYIEKCESWKVAIKNLHWSAKNMSQHELCDDIASEISDFEDLVSEVEQSITGKIKLNGFTPKSYKIKSLRSFVEDVISDSQAFLKELGRMGEKYIGIKSECESFIGTMQRKLYLVNFTMKEELKRRLKDSINESYKKEENIKTIFHGTKPSTERGLFKRINDLTKNGQLNTRTFDGVSDAIDFYRKILGNIGTLRYIDACEDDNYVVKLETEGGRSYYGIMRTKDVGDSQCKASITFSPHSSGDDNTDVDPEDNEPVIEDGNDWEEEHLEKARKGLRKRDEENFYQRHPDFRPGNGQVEEGRLMEVEYKLTEGELKQLVSGAVNRLIEDMSVTDREKRLQNQMSWYDFKHPKKDSDKENELIDLGAKGEAHARDLHSEDPELWKRVTGVRESEIKIKPENKGKFNATKKATGKSTEELKHSKNPLTRKRAIFAANAKKWNHKGNKKD